MVIYVLFGGWLGGIFLAWEDHVIASEGVGDMARLCLKAERGLRDCVEFFPRFSNERLIEDCCGWWDMWGWKLAWLVGASERQ